MIHYAAGVGLGALSALLVLLVADRITKSKLTFVEMVLIAVISALFTSIPTVGVPFGAIGIIILYAKWTDADFWPDTILVSLATQIVAAPAQIYLSGIILDAIGV